MKRNQNRVLKHSIPSRTAPQPQTPSPAQERPAVNQAILDYELVVNESIALIDLFRTPFMHASERCPKSEFEHIEYSRLAGCYQLAEGAKTRLYTGYDRIYNAMQRKGIATAEQGRATP